MKFLKTYDEKCKGCNICVETCSSLYFKVKDSEKSRIIVEKREPGIFHLIACNQCGVCVAECPVTALSVNKMGVIMLNGKLCVGCLACVAVCPIKSMRHSPSALTPIKCIACGACAKNCPEGALEIVEEVI